MSARKTPEQRLAEAQTAKMIAEFDILAERAAAAGMPAKQVRAIRCALDLFGLLDWGDGEIEDARDHITETIDNTFVRRAADHAEAEGKGREA